MTFLWFLIGYWVAIVVHEFGHFICGRIAGFNIKTIRIGEGPTLIHRSIGDTEFIVRLWPESGIVVPHGTIDNARWRELLFTIGGVLGNAAAIVILTYLISERFGATTIKWTADGVTAVRTFPFDISYGLKIMLILQYAIIVYCLFPWRLRDDKEGAIGSDGYLIWYTLRYGASNSRDVYNHFVGPYAADVGTLKPSPGMPDVLRAISEAHATASVEDFRTKKEQLIGELARNRLLPEERAMVLDTLLSDALLTPEIYSPSEIQNLCERLLALAEHLPTAHGTCGANLIEIGDVTTGEAILRDVLNRFEAKSYERAMTLVYLARARLKSGDTIGAAEFLAPFADWPEARNAGRFTAKLEETEALLTSHPAGA